MLLLIYQACYDELTKDDQGNKSIRITLNMNHVYQTIK